MLTRYSCAARGTDHGRVGLRIVCACKPSPFLSVDCPFRLPQRRLPLQATAAGEYNKSPALSRNSVEVPSRPLHATPTRRALMRWSDELPREPAGGTATSIIDALEWRSMIA